MTLQLDFLPAFVVAFLLIFARIGTMIMLVPGLGEQALPVRVRLTVGLVLSFVLLPVGQPFYPTGLLDNFVGLLSVLFQEIAVGLFVGLSMRLISYSLSVAGATMASQSGLSFAMGGDITNTGQQGALIGNFLAVLGTTLIFVTNLHYVIIAALHDSFQLFPPGQTLPVGDLAEMAVTTVSRVFMIALRMSAPFILVGVVFYFGLGLLNKLMPQMQIFFIAMPVNIMLGFVVLMILVTTLMGWYLSEFKSALQPFLAG